MDRKDQPIEESLLDWHLDRLDDRDRAWLDAELQRDAALRKKSDRVREILQPLDHWRAAPEPGTLVEKVLAYVEGRTQVRAAVAAVPTEAGRTWRLPNVSLRELVAIAACITLLIFVFVPGVSAMRDRSRRVVCAQNLGSIFRGVSAYQEAFASALPFAGSSPGSSWLPSGARNRPYASNSRHIYLLVRSRFGPTPRDFICPSDANGRCMQADDLSARADFACSANLSYASLNLAGSLPNYRPAMPIAYVSDVNPLFVGARFNAGVDPDTANSPTHRGMGQTVLTLDGNASWMTRPVYGRRKDNLWMIGNIRRYTGIEAPTRGDDVQLVPGFPATDPDVCETLRR